MNDKTFRRELPKAETLGFPVFRREFFHVMWACSTRTHPFRVETHNSNPKTGERQAQTGTPPAKKSAPHTGHQTKNHDTSSTDDPSPEDDEERPFNQEGRETTNPPTNDTKSNFTEPDLACSHSNSRSSQTKPGKANPRNACENRILVPSTKILHAAFKSRSTTQPHTGHENTRSDNASLPAPRKQ